MPEQALKSYLEHICGKDCVKENVPLSTMTTFKVGVCARFVVVKSKERLVWLLSAINYIEYPCRVIGAGSNVLASDENFDGIVIRLGMRNVVENGAGVKLDTDAIGFVKFYNNGSMLAGIYTRPAIPEIFPEMKNGYQIFTDNQA